MAIPCSKTTVGRCSGAGNNHYQDGRITVKYVVSRQRFLCVRTVRNNYRPKSSEAWVPDTLEDFFWGMSQVGEVQTIEFGTSLYNILDSITPDITGDLKIIRSEAKRLARSIMDAVHATSSDLRGRGVYYPHTTAVLKYEILKVLDAPNKIKEVLDYDA